MTTLSLKPGFWRQEHHLDRMSLRELIVAFFQYPAIIAYLVLATAAAGVWLVRPAPILATLAVVVLAVLLFPVGWYVIHRYMMHSRWMWKVSWLAATWKRIHYDHHQNPNSLEVLFGSPLHELPAIAAITIPMGYAIGGLGGAAAAFATGLVQACVNEFCHCIQHLAYTPKNRWLLRMKQRHMAHHFHDETGNFGITNFWWDGLFGTSYAKVSDRKKSPTVFNLGYTPEVAARWPRVAELSGGVATGHPATRIRASG